MYVPGLQTKHSAFSFIFTFPETRMYCRHLVSNFTFSLSHVWQ